MKREFSEASVVLLLLLLVVVLSGWRGISGHKLSTGPVDNPLRGTVVEVHGPGLSYGSYTFFSHPLTIMKLCATFYHDTWCREHIPAREMGRVLVSGDAVSFQRGGSRLRVKKMPGARRVALGILLDPNLDDEDDLVAVPGIGSATAATIINYRAQNGPFRSVEQLQQLLGARVWASEYFQVDTKN